MLPTGLQASGFTNRLLRNMPVETTSGLQLRPIRLHVGFELESPGTPVTQLVFLEAGMAIMTATFKDGSQVEAGLYGFDSVVGLSALMGTRRVLNRTYMQIAGRGYAAPIDRCRAEFERGTRFRALTLAFCQSHAMQAAQSAGCNARHDVDQRLARWILNCADRTRSLTIPISQNCLASMIGVRRMSVVIGVARLKRLQLVDHHPGQLLILDRQGLEATACECYRTVREHLESTTDFEDGCS